MGLASGHSPPRVLVAHGQRLAGTEILLSTSTHKHSQRSPRPAKLAGPWGDAALTTAVVFELFDHELLLGKLYPALAPPSIPRHDGYFFSEHSIIHDPVQHVLCLV